jgi:mRNA-degrading endonuclease toxin of MazEF toxin-antitoxin module
VSVSPLCRGRIVWVELLDPQGRNRKCRPAVIVTPDAEIQPDGEVWVVAISSQLDAAPAEDQVELPWDRRGHPKTKLKERCAAVCSWMIKVNVASIQECAGIVPSRQLLDILSRIKLPEPPGDLPASKS